MSVSGLGLNQNLFSGIDSVNAQQISGEIFSRAAQKTIDLSKTDLSQFRRPELGVDLYNSKTSLELQRQIAITQSGINTQNINTSYLNSQAASALYGGNNIAKTVDGKLFVPANSEVEPINTPTIVKIVLTFLRHKFFSDVIKRSLIFIILMSFIYNLSFLYILILWF